MKITVAYAAAFYLAILLWGTTGAVWGLVVLFPMWGVTLALFSPNLGTLDPDPTYSPLDKMDGRG